jgi:L-ribulose-5-phosphate 3-epimerase
MKKGISVWAFDPARPLPEVFRMAKEAGFDGVEVAIAVDGPITPQTTEAECQQILAQAADAGVEIPSLASGLGWAFPITAEDAEVRQKGIDATAASLRVARYLNTDAILLVPGGVGAEFIPGFPVTRYDIAYANALAALKTLAPVAAETGVTIGIENVWNKFLLSPLEMRDFIDAAGGTPLIGSYFDVGNVIATGYPEQWIEILGSRIARVHFKDFKRSVGNLSGFCDLGDGDVNWPAVLEALAHIGYQGYVTAEFFNCEGDLAKIAGAMEQILSADKTA